MIRTLAERLLAGLTVTRRLPANAGGGAFLASADAGGLKFLFRPSAALDPSLLAIARSIVPPDAIVWDVGANVGLFAVAAAGLAGPGGKVFAIEADVDVARMLMRTALLPANRGLAPIEVLPMAVSANSGVVSFRVAMRARASNALAGFGSTQMGGIRQTRLVPALPLDDLARHLPAPTVLKIDVEGAEAIVLAGARELLKNSRPIVFCEVCTHQAAAVSAEFERAGYLIFDGSRVAAGTAPAPVTLAPWDTVAIPAERSQAWAGNDVEHGARSPGIQCPAS